MKVAAKSPRRDKQDAKKPARPRKGVSKESNSQPDQGQALASERRVVLLDLDGTILDSATAWEECSDLALDELRAIPGVNLGKETALAAYRAIYECHADIRIRVGPGGRAMEDMRQEWNTRTSYSLLLAWSRRPDYPGSRGGSFEVSHFRDALEGLLRDGKQAELLFEDAEELRDTWNIEYSQFINRAVKAFWHADFDRYLYPKVKDFLRALRRHRIEYYVATEGHLPTQWHKICALGLDQSDPDDPDDDRPWISHRHLLATSEAARPHRALQALVGLGGWYRGREAASREALRQLRISGHHRSQLQLTADSSKLTAAGLARMAGFFGRLARKISRDGSGQVRPEFYRRVIYAINQSPHNPREHFKKTDFSQWTWDDRRCIHLAMIGDKHTSDVAPVLQLASELGRGIMSVWVRQGRHGAEEPKPGTEGKWVECSTIFEAGERYLLKDREWSKRTGCIVKPAGVFSSAIEPAPGSRESLLENIRELLAGIGAVRGDSSRGEQIRPDKSMIEAATTVVDNLLGSISTDIRLSRAREDVMRILLGLCRHPELRSKDGLLGQCAGLPQATVELLLAITEEEEGDATRIGRYHECLGVMADLLDTNQVEWASAVIEVLDDESKVNHICASEELSKRYHDKLLPLMNSDLPDDFPLAKAELLYTRIVFCRDQVHHTSRPPRPSSSRGEVFLGQAYREHQHQQFVFLGTDREDHSVYCALNGREVRNIVCICGSPGSGKSSTLDALAMGALRGEGLGSASPPRSAVMVFHHELSGPCEFVPSAQRAGVVTKVFAFEDELSNTRKEYRDLPSDQVKPIRYRLDQLSDDQVIRWIGLPEKGALAKAFREVFSTLGDKKSMKDLREAIETTPSLDQKQKKQVLNALKKLEPIIAKSGELTIGDEVNPGQLIVIDCARAGGLASRLPAWDMVVSVLEKHWDSDRKDEHFLLVFDELHQSLSQTDSDAKQLASRLRELGDRMGRHQQVSIVAASQSPKDFKNTGDLWEAATVLLFHYLQAEVGDGDTPNGSLWQRAKQHRDFGDLGPGQAWYCSARQAPDYVQVQRRA